MRKRALVQGVGINDVDTPIVLCRSDTQKLCPYYSRWVNLISRCYGHEPTRTMDDRFLTMSVFKAWMDTFDWVDKIMTCDIEKPHSTHYSPDTSAFLPRSLVTLMRPTNSESELPVGVIRSGKTQEVSYRARICDMGKHTSQGNFNTIEEAAAAHSLAKSTIIANHIRQELNPFIKKGLKSYIRQL